MKWVRSFSVALLSVWKEVRIYFNTVALFLLWFIHFGGMGTWFGGEYCLMCQPQELFSDLNLTLCSGHLGVIQNAGCQHGKSVQTIFQVWIITRELVIQTWKESGRKKETNRRSNPSTKHHVICAEWEMFPNVYCHPKCDECSKRREPFESLNVHWMAIIVQYST